MRPTIAGDQLPRGFFGGATCLNTQSRNRIPCAAARHTPCNRRRIFFLTNLTVISRRHGPNVLWKMAAMRDHRASKMPRSTLKKVICWFLDTRPMVQMHKDYTPIGNKSTSRVFSKEDSFCLVLTRTSDIQSDMSATLSSALNFTTNERVEAKLERSANQLKTTQHTNNQKSIISSELQNVQPSGPPIC